MLVGVVEDDVLDEPPVVDPGTVAPGAVMLDDVVAAGGGLVCVEILSGAEIFFAWI